MVVVPRHHNQAGFQDVIVEPEDKAHIVKLLSGNASILVKGSAASVKCDDAVLRKQLRGVLESLLISL